MAELADALDLGSSGKPWGSSPFVRTKWVTVFYNCNPFFLSGQIKNYHPN